MSGGSVDVAIIGGGIAGLYTAWRLSTAPNPPRIALYESSNRLGGRIDTAPLPVGDAPSSAELGAMRFFPFMEMVTNLLKYLGIETETFPGNTLRQIFLRGVPIQMDAKGNALNSPYKLNQDEPQNYFQLILNVLNGAVPNAQSLTPEQWRAVTKTGKFKDRELWRWGMENVAEEIISNQAFRFIYDAIGLDSLFLKTNAAIGARVVTQPLHDYEQGNVLRPVNGFGSLVAELEKRLSACPNCAIFKGQRLVAAQRKAGGFSLDIAVSVGPPAPVSASKVVLALPQRAIQLIDLDDLFPADQQWAQRRLLGSKLENVIGVPAFKVAMVYEKPWWNEQQWWQSSPPKAGAVGWTNGYSVTDLPIRQVFFGMGQNGSPEGNARVLLASYADSDAAVYWGGLVQVSPHSSRQGESSLIQQIAPGNLLNTLQRQLRELMQTADPLPEPLWAGYMDWSEDPFGGAWHEWLPGVDITTQIPEMRQPIAGMPLYICGEAYSWLQAWVEGALMSAERLLQDHFGLGWPSAWLPADYDIGP